MWLSPCAASIDIFHFHTYIKNPKLKYKYTERKTNMICVVDNYKPLLLGHEVVVLFDTKQRIRYSRNTSLFDTPFKSKECREW